MNDVDAGFSPVSGQNKSSRCAGQLMFSSFLTLCLLNVKNVEINKFIS